MPQIGPLEMMMVALVALVVFGPEKLPNMARSAGRTLNNLRSTAADVKRELRAGLHEETTSASAAAEPSGSTAAEASGATAVGPEPSTSGESAA